MTYLVQRNDPVPRLENFLDLAYSEKMRLMICATLITYLSLIDFGVTKPASAAPSEVTKSSTQSAVGTISLPHCVQDEATIKEIAATIKTNKTNTFKYNGYRAVLQSDSDIELIARLAYAETLAANCPELNQQIGSRIVQTIANRVRIKKGAVRDVVFRRDQFSSSLNIYSESRYLDFLCPKDISLWKVALVEARLQMAKTASGPNRNTVNYFLYKHSPKWTKEPWKLEEDSSNSTPEIRSCIKFFKDPNWK